MKQQPDHAAQHHLEREVEVGEPAQRLRGAARLLRRRRLAAGRDDAHAHEHRLRHVVGDRVLERDVARREPHLLVAAFVFPTGFVARVRFEQPALQVLRSRCPRSTRRSATACRRPARRGSSSRSPRRCRCASATRSSARARPRAAGTSSARRSGTPRATARSARRGSRCRTARGATAATRRSRARGSSCAATRSEPSASNPPWQRTPPATSGSTTSWSASSSLSVHVQLADRSSPGV